MAVAPDGRLAPRAEPTRLAVLGVAALVIGVVLTRARSLSGYLGPALFGDEMGALFTARWLTGTGVTPTMGGDSYYAPGFGILLVPVELVTNTPLGTYRAALLTNVVLVALVAPALYVFVRMTTGSSRAVAALVAGATWCSASLVVFPSLTWSESLVALVVVVTCIAFVRFDRDPSWLALAALSMACAVCYLAHSRLVVLVGVVALGVVVSGFCGRVPWRLVLVFGCATLALIGASKLLVVDPHRAALWSSNRERSLLPRLEMFGSLSGIRTLATLVAGQVWYTSVATLGLAVVGAWRLLRRLWCARQGHDHSSDVSGLSVPVALVLVLGPLAMAAAAVSFFAGTAIARADMVYYGRYIAPVLLPVSAVGLAVVIGDRGTVWTSARRGMLAGAFIISSGALLAVLGPASAIAAKRRNAFNVPGVEIALRTFGADAFLTIAAVAAVTVVVVLVIRPRPLAAALVAFLLLVPALRVADWAERNNHNTMAVIPHSLLDERGARIAVFGPMSSATPYRIQFFNPQVRVERVPMESLGGRPCVVVSNRDLGDELSRRGYTVVIEEPRGRVRLWALPAPERIVDGRVDCRSGDGAGPSAHAVTTPGRSTARVVAERPQGGAPKARRRSH